MDIFAGCGGLSEGFQQARAAVCKWAIEYEHPAAEAFKLNHPEAHVMCNNCNVILTAAMHKAGLQDICKASPEVSCRSDPPMSVCAAEHMATTATVTGVCSQFCQLRTDCGSSVLQHICRVVLLAACAAIMHK